MQQQCPRGCALRASVPSTARASRSAQRAEDLSTNGTSARVAFFVRILRVGTPSAISRSRAATGSFPAFLAAGCAGLSDSLPLLTGIGREGGSGLALFKLLRPLLECLHGAG